MRSRRSRPSIDGGNLGTGVTRRGDDCDVRSAGEQKIQVRDPVRYKAHPRRPRPARFPYLFFCVKNSPRDGIHHEPTLVGFCFPGISFRSGVPHPGIRGQRALPDIIAGGRRGDFIGHNLFFCISRDGGVHLGAAERPRTASIVRGTPFPHDTHSRLETSTGAHTVVVAVRCNVSALPPLGQPILTHAVDAHRRARPSWLRGHGGRGLGGIGMFRLLPCCLSVSALTHGGGWALKRKQQRGRVGVSVISRD